MSGSGEATAFYQKPRKDFGKPVEFQMMEPELLVDIAPDEHLKGQHVIVDPHETEIQNVAGQSENSTNTERVTSKAQGSNHVEGSWPLGIDWTEFEEKSKYCKKAERDPPYLDTVRHLLDRGMERFLKQNNAIDVYGAFFTKESDGGNFSGSSNSNSMAAAAQSASGSSAAATSAADQAPPSAKTVAVFKDPSPIKRAAVKLSWLADGRNLAVAYCHLRFQANVEGMSTSSHIWDVTNPNEPLLNLTPPSPLTCIEYYGKDPHMIAGGSYNGVVQYWDTRQPQRPVARSAIEESHKDAVWDIKWLQSRQGEILTVSTDGQAFVWDVRKAESPTEIIVLKKNDSETLALHPNPKNNDSGPRGQLGGTCLDYDAAVGGPQKYMVGTEQGTILNVNRKLKGADRILAITFNGHHGPVYTVQRNPAHNKYFLSIGDWTARLWAEEIKGPALYSTFYHRSHLTSGCWHPQRCGVFFTTRMDGVVDVWDLTYRQSSAVLSLQVSDYALHTIRPTQEGHYVAVGGVDGSTSLLELSSSLYTPAPNEKQMIAKLFDNESQRDKNLQSKNLKKKAARGQQQQKQQETTAASTAADDAALEAAAQSFLDSVRGEEAEQKKQVAELEAQRRRLLQNVEEGVDIDAVTNNNMGAAAAIAAGH